MPTAVLIQHVPHESAGWLFDLLDEAGVDLDVRRMWLDEAVPVDAAEGDGLVVLGGPMGAYDDADASWLPAVRQLLVDAAERTTPTLALCLGAQLLAVAAGGVVEKGAAGPELGLCAVTLKGVDDPLLSGLTGEVPVVQWHWDHVSVLPPGATLLASSAAYAHQAFRVGDRAWGMQFHPEVTLPLVAQWAQDDRDALRTLDLDPVGLVGAVADAERGLLEIWTPVLERFAAMCA